MYVCMSTKKDKYELGLAKFQQLAVGRLVMMIYFEGLLSPDVMVVFIRLNLGKERSEGSGGKSFSHLHAMELYIFLNMIIKRNHEGYDTAWHSARLIFFFFRLTLTNYTSVHFRPDATIGLNYRLSLHATRFDSTRTFYYFKWTTPRIQFKIPTASKASNSRKGVKYINI